MPGTGFAAAGSRVALNTSLLNAAGVPQPGFNWTWQDLVTVAQKLTKGPAGSPEAQWGVDFAKTTWEGLWQDMLGSYGGHVWSADRTASTINSQAAKTTFQYFKDLADRWNVSGPDPKTAQFYAGKIGMTAEWAGDITTQVLHADFPVYVNLMPTGPDGGGVGPPTGHVHAYTIAATSKHPEDAWQYVDFMLTSPDAERARVPSSVELISWKPNLSVYASKLSPKLKQWWSTQEYYLAHVPAFQVLPPEVSKRLLPSYDNQMKIITAQLKRFYGGEIAVGDAVGEMERQLDAALKQSQALAPK